ncbi:transposase, partial [Bradyrhizobium sp. Cp5.3]|uniref:transposase n=1 Tax=Bradyrhizobium sp. Cp5.3 TaxID=443598 RepID=UPI0018DD45C5
MSKDSRKDSDKDRHTPIFEDGADTLQRVEIITGTGRRRRWSTDAKGTIVAESFAPGASVSAVARRHDISPGLLFLWRRQTTRAKVA